MAITVAGIDGCSGGWVIATVRIDDGQAEATVSRVTTLDRLIEHLDSGQLDAAGIDIPIGLPDSGPRRCDIEARKMIEVRRSSVFPAPVRGLLGSATYDEAVEQSLAIQGKSLSKQAFAILPKIEEIDRFMSPERQQHLVEVHPEVCLKVLSGSRMRHLGFKSWGRTRVQRATGQASLCRSARISR